MASVDTDSLFRVDGMVAVITGGGSGLGLTMAHALVSAGASKVFLLGRRMSALEAAAASNPSFVPIKCDVTSKEDLAVAVEAVSMQTTHINLLVANSGIGGSPERLQPSFDIQTIRRTLWDADPADWNQAFAINVTGMHFTIVAFLELLGRGNEMAMKGQGFGGPAVAGGRGDTPNVQSQIIVTSSISAFSRHWMSPFNYAATKAAAMQLSKLWATRLANVGIRCNAMAPGIFPSEMTLGLMAGRDPSTETYETDSRFIPAKRFGSDEEMAGNILYLASRAGAYTNGCILLQDGGRLGVIPSTY